MIMLSVTKAESHLVDAGKKKHTKRKQTSNKIQKIRLFTINFFRPLSDLYESIEDDMLQKWNLNQDVNSLIVFRDELMKAAKISSRLTYNKYVNQLREFGLFEKIVIKAIVFN